MENFIGSTWGVTDLPRFQRAMFEVIECIQPGGRLFLADGLFTYGKSLGFLDDAAFMAACKANIETEIEASIVWRLHTLCWAARRALALPGDFVECGTYKGVTAKIIADCTDLVNQGKTFYLYDLFEHDTGMRHHALPEHGPELYQATLRRFAGYPHVRIVRGMIPESFGDAAPDRIAFLHVDLNDAQSEIAALDHLFDRVVPGGAIVLDDFGWARYREQMVVETKFFADRNLAILELPTGQGLIIK